MIKIVDTCLRQVAYDAKSGSYDIDKMMTGFSKGKRDLIRMIKEAVKTLADDSGRASREHVLDLLVQKGINRDDARKQLEMLLTSGEAMEPKSGIIKLI